MSDYIDAWEAIAAGADHERRAAISPAEFRGEYDRSGEEEAAALLGMVADRAPREVWLDFGSGDGRITEPLARAVRRVYAVDAAPSMLSALEARNLANVTTEVYTGAPLTVDEPIDVAVSVDVLIHNPYEVGRTILGHIGQVMRRDGVGLIEVPVYDVAHEPTAHLGDVGTWTPDMLTRAANRAGFVVEVMQANPGAFSWEAIGPVHGKVHVLRWVGVGPGPLYGWPGTPAAGGFERPV